MTCFGNTPFFLQNIFSQSIMLMNMLNGTISLL